VVVPMRRKKESETVEKLTNRQHRDALEVIARKVARFCADSYERLVQSTPQLPRGLNDRAADNWTPLIAIADIAGGEWPALARHAAVALSGTEEEDGTGIELLRSIKRVFDEIRADRIRSSEIVSRICSDPTARWVEYNQGRSISEKQLAGLLRPFGISPNTVRFGSGPNDTAKGYLRERFDDAFARYLPGESVTASQLGRDDALSDLIGPPTTSVSDHARDSGSVRL